VIVMVVTFELPTSSGPISARSDALVGPSALLVTEPSSAQKIRSAVAASDPR